VLLNEPIITHVLKPKFLAVKSLLWPLNKLVERDDAFVYKTATDNYKRPIGIVFIIAIIQKQINDLFKKPCQVLFTTLFTFFAELY